MEAYIGKCLDSLLIPEFDQVEVLVVNDGSKDRSSEIAHSYAERYPDSIRVIDKPNGHYGSCINTALPQAKGRYVRILDSDDWFDSSSLSLLIKELNSLNVDVVFTRNSVYYEADHRTEHKTFGGLIYGQMLNLNSYSIPKECLKMHCLTYRTDFLKQIGYHQTEGICYTDNEYVAWPLLKANTFYAIDCSLYQYRIGRGEQSVSIDSIVKNVEHYLKVINTLARMEITDTKRDKHIRQPILLRLIRITLDVLVLFRMSSQSQETLLKEVLSGIKKNYPDEFNKIMKHKIKMLPLYRIWYGNSRLYYALIYPFVKQSK